MQGTRSVDSGSPWHETSLPLPALAGQLYNLTASLLLSQTRRQLRPHFTTIQADALIIEISMGAKLLPLPDAEVVFTLERLHRIIPLLAFQLYRIPLQ